MEEPIPLQEIIGVDKKNPFLTVCKDPQQPGKLMVFFGAVLLEIVDDDRENPSFKLLLARLYNAKVKVKTLVETFGVAHTTLKRWGDALKSDDPERLVCILAGRQHPRKLTAEILGFAKKRFSHIYPHNHYSHSQQIREEIQATFEVTLSSETLRPYFAQWKPLQLSDAVQKPEAPQGASGENQPPSGDPGGEHTAHDDPGCLRAASEHAPLEGVPPCPQDPNSLPGRSVDADATLKGHESCERLPGHGAVQEALPVVSGVPNRKHTEILEIAPGEGYQFCHHAGILLFSAFMQPLSAGLGEAAALTKQWLAAVLLGAMNIEQSKLLDWGALQFLLGEVVVNLHQQRQALGELALTGAVELLLRFNGTWAGIEHCRDFYYDPHSKHYTGMKKILKGWCARLRFAEKVLHMDFIHTVSGAPVYIVHDDNFRDLRERFFDVVVAFRAQFSLDRNVPLTFVVDRGLYSLSVFEQLIADPAATYFVTWEKGYQGDLAQALVWTGTHNLYRAKNASQDLRRFDFQYRDEPWSRDETIRRVIVRAKHPNGNAIQVSILTNDPSRCAKELITLMFNRWLQENDFKYLDNHFGINEITAYGSVSYKELSQTIEDKQMKSGEYKALEKQRTAIKRQLKTRLLQKHCAKRNNKKTQEDIDQLTKRLAEVEAEMANTNKEVSRLETLIEQDFHKLDSAKKALMDSIKITARNLFYILLQPFKQAYNNYRDDHVLFRHLTRSHGLLRDRGPVMEVLLFPEARFPPKVVGIINEMLAQLNASQLSMPNGSGKTLYFRLIQQESILFCINHDQ
ncbi:MAG: hypothetical protein GY923_19690 [Aestuariibacter sp.]|nr:hypothetical protein [Aestuariibacter sp.]